MALPQWQAVRSLATPNVNPNQALNVATNAFGNISDTIRADESAAQEAAYRQGLLEQQQAEMEWEQGEDDRAKQRVIDMSNSFKDAYGQGVSAQKDAFRMDDANVSALMAETGLSEEEVRTKGRDHITSNEQLFLNPDQLQADVVGRMAEQGYLEGDFANLMGNRLSQSGFNKSSPETIEMMLDSLIKPTDPAALLKGGRSSRRGGTRGQSDKEIATNNARADNALINETAERYRSGSRPWYSLNVGDEDIYEDNFRSGVSKVKGATKTQVPFIIQAIDSLSEDNTLPFKLGNDMTADQVKLVGDRAKLLESASYTGGTPGSSGNGDQVSLQAALGYAEQDRANYRQQVNDTIATGQYNTVTKETRLSSLREAFGLTAKQAQKVDNKLDTKSKKQSKAPADDSVDGLLDSALSGGSANSGGSPAPSVVEKAVEQVTGKKPAAQEKDSTNFLMETLTGKKSNASKPGSFRHDAVEPAKAFVGSLYDKLINAGGDAIGAVAGSEPAQRFAFARQFNKDNGRNPTEQEIQAFLSQ